MAALDPLRKLTRRIRPVTRLNAARLTGSATGWEHFNPEHAPPVSVDQQMSVWTDGRAAMVAGVIAKLPNVVGDLEQSAIECEGVRSDVVIWVHGFILLAAVAVLRPDLRRRRARHLLLRRRPRRREIPRADQDMRNPIDLHRLGLLLS
jgi:hypothetical protein